jgi:hypothetical protein
MEDTTYIDEVMINLNLFFEIFLNIGTWTVQSLVRQIESLVAISSWYDVFGTLQIHRMCVCYESAILDVILIKDAQVIFVSRTTVRQYAV